MLALALGTLEPAQASAKASVVAWAPPQDLEYPDWVTSGRRLGAMGRCSPWWLGDWIRYGNARFGERYARASRITGYDVQTLMNMVYVASRYEISRRRENLSWSHHETLAALDEDDQEHWLDRAVGERLSVSDLRVELRSVRRDGRRGATGATRQRAGNGEVVVCPNCGQAVLLRAHEEPVEDVTAGERPHSSAEVELPTVHGQDPRASRSA